nr:hypothetical protein [Tanacetum cinerariifolium]
MMTDKDSSAAGTDNRLPMLEENDYESWRIPPKGGAVPPPRNKRDEEFTEENNRNELADIQAFNILSQGSGQTLERRKEALFDEFERFRANANELIQDYFVHFHKLLLKQFRGELWVTRELRIVTKTVQRRALGNTGTKGIQTTGSGVNNSGKKWYHDKALLMQAKEKGDVLDAKDEAFLADVECTAPYDQPLALTTTNLFEANHEDAYDYDVDEGPHTYVAFMANHSSIGGTNGSSSSHINEVQISDDSFFSDVSYPLAQEMQQEEHLNSKVDSVLDDNMITYDE